MFISVCLVIVSKPLQWTQPENKLTCVHGYAHMLTHRDTHTQTHAHTPCVHTHTSNSKSGLTGFS